MTQGLREMRTADLAAELERTLFPVLAEKLCAREAGHCMRVSDLDQELMVRLCQRLRSEVPNATVVILGNGVAHGVPKTLRVSSTKLVELRNPRQDGTLRPPLLVLLPSEVRAAAEDSFGIATFEEVQIGDVYRLTRDRLLEEQPSVVKGSLAEALRRLEDDGDPWVYADPVSQVRFLITAKVNGGDPEAIGGALYELGLVPDFELFADPVNAPFRIGRNRECVETLTRSPKTERGRVLDIGLAKRAFRNQLANFLVDAGLEDPRGWTRQIVLDRNLWPLSFDHWEFEDGGEAPDAIFIGEVVTDLPVIPDDEQDEHRGKLIGQQVLPLGKGGLRKFAASFRVDPHPGKVQGLAKFVLQVVSKEQGPVGLVRSKSVWKTASLKASVSFAKLNKIDWDEGWHFVRVLAQTEDGDLIPLVDEDGTSLPWVADVSDTEAARPNESDLFYVLPEGDIEEPPPQRAVQREASLIHAQLRLQFAALLDDRDPGSVAATGVGWAERTGRAAGAGTDMLEVQFGREGLMHVPVSRPLKVLEQKILMAPDGAISWRLPIELGATGHSTGESSVWPDRGSVKAFLAARAEYFATLRAGNRELVSQGADFRHLKKLVFAYASAYLGVLSDLRLRAAAGGAGAQRDFADLRKMLAVDSVALAISDYKGRRRDATLVAPTHPLRALWFVVWAELGADWLAAAEKAPKEYAVPVRDALVRQLSPVGFPPVLPTEGGHVLTPIDNLHPFWSLYAPSYEEDPRGLVGDVCAALGLPEPAIGGALIDGPYLATRVQRYLLQHPYVQTLVINAFNAGRAHVLADMLLQLQKVPAFSDLRYDIRLFVPDAEAPGVGAGLIDLLSPTASLTAREADVFSTPTENHLRPKLRVATRRLTEFRSAPETHTAHLSLLFDVFPAEDVGVSVATLREAAAPVHGLVQDFQVEYREDESVVAWRKQPRHGEALPIQGAEELTDALAKLAAELSAGTAAVATGQAGNGMRPSITLTLGTEDRALLHQVHDVSDWVLTLDRNMGIEFFDHGGKAGRPDYLIDHSPDMANSLGHRLVITSRSVAELEAMLTPVLQQYGLSAEGRNAVPILDQLRSLSGRLALKLISSPTQRAEALGLALSRMYLEHQGVFENQVVVPLDAHLELYTALKQHANELGDEVSLKRTDLALFDLDVADRVITCRLVEVKCYSQVGDLVAFNQLKTKIAEQIEQSQEVIARHFDPQRSSVDRPDRLIKTREFVALIEFYLDRAERYGVFSSEAADEARFFLRTMEDGYRLEFTRSALIFDFEKPGTEPAELENGIEYHRVGVDLIRQLVDAAAPGEEARAAPPAEEAALVPAMPEGMLALTQRRERAPAVRLLRSAAFLAEKRDRTVSWEDLRSKRVLGTEDRVDSEDRPEPSAESEKELVPAHQAKRAVDLSDSPTSTPSMQRTAEAETESVPETEEATKRSTPGESHVAGVVAYDVLLGATGESPQYGIIGEVSGRRVALDLNQTHTISLFGVQGGGKSYTLGMIAEMASLPIENINLLPNPLATVIFHYSPTMDYKPEFTSMVDPNSDEAQLRALRDTYGAEPKALSDVVLLVPADKLEERRSEYPGMEVLPLKFAAAELQTSHWRFLMGAVGNQATYIRQLNRVMKALRSDLSLENLRQGIDGTNLPDHLKDLAHMRLDLAADYIDDAVRLSETIRPGRLIIVDLREEFIEKDEALGLFVVLLQLFADAKHAGRSFNKLVVFDEAHKYIESPDLVAGLVEVVREMRHKGTSILVASQDPPSVPVSLIELSSQIILHKFNSPAWLKHIQKANAALAGLTSEKMAQLKPGEAFVWSSKATDAAFTRAAMKIRCRPRVTLHGGATRTAV